MLNAKIENDNLTCYADAFSYNLRYYICADCLQDGNDKIYSCSVFDINTLTATGEMIENIRCSSKEEVLLNYSLLLEAYLEKE